MLLIGGALLEAREHLSEATAAFVAEVHRYDYGMPTMDQRAISRSTQGARTYRWEGVRGASLQGGRSRACSSRSPGRSCSPIPTLQGELRYFEMAPGGFSTLERHEHMHAVLILRGRGHCLVGDEVSAIETRDLVTVPADDLAPVPRHQRASRSAFSAWSMPRATSRNCPRRRIWPSSSAMQRSPPSCGASRKPDSKPRHWRFPARCAKLRSTALLMERIAMSYTLDQFVSDCRSILKRAPGPDGREEVRQRLERLLSQKEFVDEYCGPQVQRGLRCSTKTPSRLSNSRTH